MDGSTRELSPTFALVTGIPISVSGSSSEHALLIALDVLSPAVLSKRLGMRRMAMFWHTSIDFTLRDLPFQAPAFVSTVSPGTSTIQPSL